MSLDSCLNDVLDSLLSAQSLPCNSNTDLIKCIDLTLLDQSATPSMLDLIKHQAIEMPIAAVCVYPEHLNRFNELVTCNLATVINFPEGDQELLSCLANIDQAVNSGVQEIDYVIPYNDYIYGNKQRALNHCDVIIQDCKKLGLTLKVILETGAFPDMESIYQLSLELINLGVPFLKTSTGKITAGATLGSAFAILTAINDSPESECGIKLSGGVKTPVQARQFACLAELVLNKAIHPSWFRIGASSLLNHLTS